MQLTLLQGALLLVLFNVSHAVELLLTDRAHQMGSPTLPGSRACALKMSLLAASCSSGLASRFDPPLAKTVPSGIPAMLH